MLHQEVQSSKANTLHVHTWPRHQTSRTKESNKQQKTTNALLESNNPHKPSDSAQATFSNTPSQHRKQQCMLVGPPKIRVAKCGVAITFASFLQTCPLVWSGFKGSLAGAPNVGVILKYESQPAPPTTNWKTWNWMDFEKGTKDEDNNCSNRCSFLGIFVLELHAEVGGSLHNLLSLSCCLLGPWRAMWCGP